MKKPILFFVVLSIASLISCLKSENQEPEILCASPTEYWLRFNWVDSSGNDLIFGENSVFNLDDIRYISGYNGRTLSAEDMHLWVDSLSSDTLSVLFPLAVGDGIIQLGNLQADTLQFMFEQSENSTPCFASRVWSGLVVNGVSRCAPCTSGERIFLQISER